MQILLNANGMAQTSISFGAMSNDPGSNVCQGRSGYGCIFINSQAIANAGADARICASQRHLHSTEVLEEQPLRQLVNYRYRHLCPNANALNAVYTFSAADTMANQVDLILTTNDPIGLF